MLSCRVSFLTLIRFLRAIHQSVQFVKCAAQFRNHACAICKFCFKFVFQTPPPKLNPNPNLTLILLTVTKSRSAFCKLRRLTNCAQQDHHPRNTDGCWLSVVPVLGAGGVVRMASCPLCRKTGRTQRNCVSGSVTWRTGETEPCYLRGKTARGDDVIVITSLT